MSTHCRQKHQFLYTHWLALRPSAYADETVGRAARLRAYANAVEKQETAAGGPSAEQVDWLSWARAKAAGLNPLVQVSDPILDAPEPTRPNF